jgi:zinc transporter ZupT
LPVNGSIPLTNHRRLYPNGFVRSNCRLLSGYPQIIFAIMLFAAGGILYVIFQDIAPQSKLKKHWAPPLGAVAGFLLGVLGKVAVGA